MSEIIQTEAFVLTKLNYGETSSIISLFTKDYGKFGVILKGGRSAKSKIGLAVDPINHLQVIIYQKKERELQILTGADIISHYPNIKRNFDKLKYCYAILELVKDLLLEEQVSEKIFRGVVKIFALIEEEGEGFDLLFARFFLFFLKEIGYEFQFQNCSACGKANVNEEALSYSREMGILCFECKRLYPASLIVEPELFQLFYCLKNNLRFKAEKKGVIEKGIKIMEMHLKHHINDFSGIKSLKIT
jgi:DNA repair protein RecO (recombination protein O)